MAKRLPATKSNDRLTQILSHAERGERSVLRRGKKRIAAVVPIDDFDFLEELEDRLDIEEARKRLHEPRIPWEKIKAELGL